MLYANNHQKPHFRNPSRLFWQRNPNTSPISYVKFAEEETQSKSIADS